MKSVTSEKSFLMAVSLIELCKRLYERREFVLSRQILRSGTAVGALVREAQNAESKRDFVHKLAIAQKECDETSYWLELLHATYYIDPVEFSHQTSLVSEVLKLIRSSILTAKRNLKP